MVTYSAFISYSHTADSNVAEAIQSALHRFAKPWYKLRALHVFRDQTNLAVNPALWSSIREALDEADYLILLASAEAAASPWVSKEAEYWVGKNGPAHVLIVLTGGTLQWDRPAATFTPGTNALPAALLRSFPEEPLYLDLRWARDSGARLRLREPRFHEAILQLAATLHNRPKDELDGADIRSRRHARLLGASGVIAILLTALFALWQTRADQRDLTQNLAAHIAASSAKVLADNPDRASEAALLAIESNRLSPSFEGNRALRAAVALLPAGTQSYAPEVSDEGERVRDLAFSPDGAALAVARDDGSTQVFDVSNHKPAGHFRPDLKAAASIELPEDPNYPSFDNNAAVSTAFNSTGSLLASGTRDGVARIWSLPEGQEMLQILHGAPLSAVSFHPTSNQLLTASDDGHVRVFDVARKAMAADFKCPDKVVAASFSPDGSVIGALSSDGAVSIFDFRSRRLLRTFGGGEAAFNLAFSRDGKRLADTTGDFAVVWDVSSGRQLLKATHAPSSETLTPQQWIVDTAISSDGKFMAYAARGDKLVRVWNVDTGRQILELKHDSAVASVAFNAEGDKLGTGSYDGTARVWELPSGSELGRVSHANGAEVVAFSAQGNRFAAGGMLGSVSVSENRRADRPVSFLLPGDVRSVAFSPDGRRFAIGARSEHSSPLLRVAGTDGTIVRDIEFHGAPVVDKVVFLPGGNDVIALWSSKLFLIHAKDSSVTVLPDQPGDKRITPSGRAFATQRQGVSQFYSLPGMQPTAAVNDPASARLRAVGEGGLLGFEIDKPPKDFAVEIWNAAGKTRLTHIPLPSDLSRLALNASGDVAFTSEGENLQAWEIPSGKRRFSITDTGTIDQIVPDPSAAAFATITNRRLTVWDARTGARMAQLPDEVSTAAFSPDGRYLVTGSGRAAAMWLWRSGDLRDQACTRLASNFSREEWARWFPQQPYRQTCSSLPAIK